MRQGEGKRRRRRRRRRRRKEQAADFDSPWKEALEQYFRPFVELLLPDVAAEIDWDAGVVFLDKELQKIARTSATGRRIVDKLVEVRRRDGEPLRVLVHVEVHGRRQGVFEQRMFTYHTRLVDHFGAPVVSIAVLIDPDARWRPTEYRYAMWGTELRFRFRAIKLLDFRERIEELEASPNPFAMVVLAQLRALETRDAAERRLGFKLELTQRLYARGYQRDEVLSLLRFIDWILALPEELERRYTDRVEQLDEEEKMPYVTSFERFARQDGEKEGTLRSLRVVLELRLGALPAWVGERLAKAELPELEAWLVRAVQCDSLEDVFEDPKGSP